MARSSSSYAARKLEAFSLDLKKVRNAAERAATTVKINLVDPSKRFDPANIGAEMAIDPSP